MCSAHHLLRLLALLPVGLFALYVGNPSAPDLPPNGFPRSDCSPLALKLGYEGSLTFDRHLKIDRRTIKEVDKEIDRARLILNQGLIILNIINRVELYGGLGALKCELAYTPISSARLTIYTPDAFSWEIGGRTLLIFWRRAALGFDVKLLASQDKASSVTFKGTPISHFHPDYKYKEWQVGGGFSYNFEWFIPYVGMLYSDVKMRLWDLSTLNFPDYKPKKETFIDREHYALIVGVSLSAQRLLSCTLEGAFFGESRLSANLNLRF